MLDKIAIINTLRLAIRLTDEVNWLTSLVARELANDELSPKFHSRMLGINSVHLREVVEIVRRAQEVIEASSIDPLYESTHPLSESSDLDQSPNPPPP